MKQFVHTCECGHTDRYDFRAGVIKCTNKKCKKRVYLNVLNIHPMWADMSFESQMNVEYTN